MNNAFNAFIWDDNFFGRILINVAPATSSVKMMDFTSAKQVHIVPPPPHPGLDQILICEIKLSSGYQQAASEDMPLSR